MADGLFDSAWLKWGWATKHAESLKEELARFGQEADDDRIVTARAEYQAKRHGFAIIIDSISPLPVDWSLRLGDIAHNYRSCLDHIAWALVTRGTRPPNTLTEFQCRGISFPLAENPADLRNNLRSKRPSLPGVGRADLALVRRYQPYKWGKRALPLLPLAILGRFNNLDKHRAIQPVLTVPFEGVVRHTKLRDAEATDTRRRARTVPLQVGTEVRTVRVRKTGPNPTMEVEISLAAEIRLDSLVTVEEWLTRTTTFIYTLLLDAGGRPPNALSALSVDFDAVIRECCHRLSVTPPL